MLKKLLALTMAVLMVLSLAACGNQSDTQPTDEAVQTDAAAPTDEAQGEETAESDLAYIQSKGTLVVGITDFAPMDYQDDNGEWIGFDADMARAFAEDLGVDVVFQEINWDNKVMELNSKNVDCLWNGMTLTDEVTSSMACSTPYSTNAQVLVVPADKAGDFEGLTTLEGLTIAVESGSAGQAAAEALGATTVPVQSQANTLMEVSAGTSDAAVIDLLMAGAMIGEGTSYANLTYTMNLNTMQGLPAENYGVGFRTGSDLVDAYNNFWDAAIASGLALETATTYGVQESIIQ